MTTTALDVALLLLPPTTADEERLYRSISDGTSNAGNSASGAPQGKGQRDKEGDAARRHRLRHGSGSIDRSQQDEDGDSYCCEDGCSEEGATSLLGAAASAAASSDPDACERGYLTQGEAEADDEYHHRLQAQQPSAAPGGGCGGGGVRPGDGAGMPPGSHACAPLAALQGT
jgi:hypothetical protein